MYVCVGVCVRVCPSVHIKCDVWRRYTEPLLLKYLFLPFILAFDFSFMLRDS